MAGCINQLYCQVVGLELESSDLFSFRLTENTVRGFVVRFQFFPELKFCMPVFAKFEN